jgi:hypothetical protein
MDKWYVLGPGGLHGRVEEGKLKHYQPGDKILLSDEEAASVHLKGRLTPAAQVAAKRLASKAAESKVVEEEEERPTVLTADDLEAATRVEPDQLEPAKPTEEAEVGEVEERITLPPASRPRLSPDDWAFITNSNLHDVVDLVKSMDSPEELDALKAAEAAAKNRKQILNAAATRKRQLGAARAQAALKAKRAAAKSASK